MKKFCYWMYTLVCALGLALSAIAQPANSDELFAEWLLQPDTHPQVPNNSFAGYRRGQVSIPDVPVVNNVVVDFGADPTGVEDSTKAFWRAIWGCRGARRRGGVYSEWSLPY
ncbi:MAG: hypothetical protein LR015_10430 [Verrucomicrobia bacterium]|nr:hypothetical protein [Verrucomicrobiota bacterium]